MAAIVRDLALKTPGKGRRTFVNFYLPGMKAGEAPWASATHAGDIAVVVEGGAVEGDEGEASASPGALPPDALVGAGDATATFAVAWPAPGERIVIERRAGRLTATTIGDVSLTALADPSTAGAADIADIGFVRAASAWLPALRLVGLALILTSVVLTLTTIQKSIRFQGHRVTELARGV